MGKKKTWGASLDTLQHLKLPKKPKAAPIDLLEQFNNHRTKRLLHDSTYSVNGCYVDFEGSSPGTFVVSEEAISSSAPFSLQELYRNAKDMFTNMEKLDMLKSSLNAVTFTEIDKEGERVLSISRVTYMVLIPSVNGRSLNYTLRGVDFEDAVFYPENRLSFEVHPSLLEGLVQARNMMRITYPEFSDYPALVHKVTAQFASPVNEEYPMNLSNWRMDTQSMSVFDKGAHEAYGVKKGDLMIAHRKTRGFFGGMYLMGDGTSRAIHPIHRTLNSF